MAKNAFESLLETLPEDQEFEFKGSVRQATAALAEKFPKLRESVLAQADYSRRMDEVRDKVNLADQWTKWRQDNWLENERKTKAEAARDTRISELERDLEAARQAALATGDEMTFEQLNQALEKFQSDKGIVTKNDLDKWGTDKEKSLTDYIKGNNQIFGRMAVDVPYIMARHSAEFGEVLDPDPVIKAAAEKGNYNLRDFYERDFVVERREKARTDKHAAELKKIQDEADAKVKAAQEEAERLKTQMTGATGTGNPVDMGTADMGPLQRQMQMPAADNSGGDQKPPDAPLGEGSIAAFAARQFALKQAQGRA